MRRGRYYFAGLLALVPHLVFAQFQVQVQGQGQEPPAPKFIPALGWDRSVQGAFPTCVVADAQNAVWVGTEGNGLWCYSPREKKWKQFTAKDDGLGDDCIYALAVDKLGRVWAGHLNHGVSVWNGEKWKNYSILDGPLGSRVFAIATCPADDDVWIATDCGVARYSMEKDDWDYFTRASGLPSDQIQTIGFSAKGTIYLGTQCDGVAIATPAEKYKKWTVLNGPPQMPNAASGTGLSTDLINYISVVDPPANVALNGELQRVIIATPVGISTISHSNGERLLNFLRGEDWQENVNGLFDVPPAPPASQPMVGGQPIIIRGGGMLIINGRVINGGGGGGAVQRGLPMEDWVTCTRQDQETGSLWTGYRQKGLEIRNFGITPAVRVDTGGLDSLEVRSIWIGPKAPPLIAIYDADNGGLFTLDSSKTDLHQGAQPPKAAPPLPAPAKAPDADSTTPLTNQVEKFNNEMKAGEVVYIGDDWTTGGDWIGHYGTAYAMLCGMGNAGIYEGEEGYKVKPDIGPHQKEKATVETFVADQATDDGHVLYNPTEGHRVQSEINDGSQAKDIYPQSWEGPDLWINVTVPDGLHIMSLYFQNNDAHTGPTNKLRDYDIQILATAKTKELTLKGDPLARVRVTDFWGGVYKQFAIAGPAKYVVKIGRNRSVGTKLQGLFFDRIEETEVKKKPLPGFDTEKYEMPEVDDKTIAGANDTVTAAATLWGVLDDGFTKSGLVPLQYPLRIWAYRTAVAGNGPQSLLANWRWELGIWTQEDRDAFQKAMEAAYKAYSAKHPPAKKNEKPSN